MLQNLRKYSPVSLSLGLWHDIHDVLLVNGTTRTRGWWL